MTAHKPRPPGWVEFTNAEGRRTAIDAWEARGVVEMDDWTQIVTADDTYRVKESYSDVLKAIKAGIAEVAKEEK